MADSLRAEVNPLGVRVLSLYPGRTATPMQAQVFALEGRPYTPDRLMQPEDVAHTAVAALALPRSAEVSDIHVQSMQRA
jgi:short-subunit dehydrogenase